MSDSNTPEKWRVDPWIPMSKPIDLKHLGKLQEELGESCAAVARCIIQGIDELEPITRKCNRQWLEEELADVMANIELVIHHFKLNFDEINLRKLKKMQNLQRWHLMSDHIPPT